jgi:hypothetical protein
MNKMTATVKGRVSVKEDNWWRQIDNWKILNKIALASGVVFIVFAALTVVVNYEIDKITYTSQAPATFIQLTILSSTLPFLLSAIISFIIAFISGNASKSEVEKQIETQPKQQVNLEEAQKEMATS